MEIFIPGLGNQCYEYLFLDLNGTLAVDGIIDQRTKKMLKELTSRIRITILSSDTYGTLDSQVSDLKIEYIRIVGENAGIQKEHILKKYNLNEVIAIGNGANDERMLTIAGLGICILGKEGASFSALKSSKLVFGCIDNALGALLNPDRLVAVLRQ